MIRYIDLNKKYIFEFVEDKDLCNKNPLEDYYLNVNDLSINSIITLKWLKWGFYFYTEMIKSLDEIENEIEINTLTEDSINKILFDKKKKILTIDENVIETENDLNKLTNFFYIPNLFHENTKIEIKLQLNVNEFLAINNTIYPNLCKYNSEKL